MNYSTDTPIKTTKEDLLGRATFSNQLAEAICKADAKDGLVIGVYGKWGTGKTSIINMIEEKIGELESTEEKPIVVKFSPWNYSDKNNLISLFFENLKGKLKNYEEDNKDLKKAGEFLSNYADSFELLSVIPGIGAPLGKLLEILTKEGGKYFAKEESLDQAKGRLKEALLLAEQKILIVIDDIDRLTNLQIRDIFQLVKQVANFPNLIYLLVMDREVVRRALKSVHGTDGKEYLDKIVQLPFEIPSINKRKIEEIFFTRLKTIIKEVKGITQVEPSYRSTVFYNCVRPYIHTIRDINRLLNTFQFKFRILCEETSFEDMLAITALEVLEPDLYGWIKKNKNLLLNNLGILGGNTEVEKIEYRNKYKAEFERLNLDAEQSIRFVSTIFPVFADNIGELREYFEHRLATQKRMGIAYEERFDVYFEFDLSDIPVSRTLINRCIKELDEKRLTELLMSINASGNIYFWIEEISALIDDVLADRLSVIGLSILNIISEFKGEKRVGIFMESESRRAGSLVLEAMKRMKSKSVRYEFLITAMERESFSGIGIIATILQRIVLGYEDLDNPGRMEYRELVTVSQLEKLKELCIERIVKASMDEDFLSIYDFPSAIYLWNEYDKSSVKSYLESVSKDDITTLKFVCAFARRWIGGLEYGWSFELHDYKAYIDNEVIRAAIERLDKKILLELTEEEQIKIASFVLQYDEAKIGNVKEEDAIKLVEEWKCERILI